MIAKLFHRSIIGSLATQSGKGEQHDPVGQEEEQLTNTQRGMWNRRHVILG